MFWIYIPKSRIAGLYSNIFIVYFENEKLVNVFNDISKPQAKKKNKHPEN